LRRPHRCTYTIFGICLHVGYKGGPKKAIINDNYKISFLWLLMTFAPTSQSPRKAISRKKKKRVCNKMASLVCVLISFYFSVRRDKKEWNKRNIRNSCGFSILSPFFLCNIGIPCGRLVFVHWVEEEFNHETWDIFTCRLYDDVMWKLNAILIVERRNDDGGTCFHLFVCAAEASRFVFPLLFLSDRTRTVGCLNIIKHPAALS